MAERDDASVDAVRAAARRYGLSEGAVEALWQALVRGRGQAQFDHPELGGMGQWSGGMLQIGDMFNAPLKARVAAACADLAASVREGRAEASPDRCRSQGAMAPAASSGTAARTSVPRTGLVDGGAGPAEARPTAMPDGWQSRYGPPASSGSQDGMRYAYFPDRHRLVVEHGGRVTVYDTGPHRLIGVSQQQGRDRRLVFASPHGTVDLESLREVED